jgi:predicted glycogen debranching enzyme
MAYFNLDKSKLGNLEYSLYKEVLRTNRAGSYSSSTIIGCNTRKYHGMLVCPVEHFNGGRFVLLSALDISLVQHQQVFNLGIHKYQGSHYEPKGHKYLVDFEMDITPKRIYRVGGMILSTELVLAENEEQLLYKVTLEQATSETKIRFKPFLAYRSVHDLTRQNMVANTRFQVVDSGISVKMYEGFPSLVMQINANNEFIPIPDWYKGVEYIKEQHRGYPYKEDLFVPGYFELDIKKGESIVFSASTSEIKPKGLKAKFSREINKRIPRDTLLHNLLNSAGQFIQNNGSQVKLIAGYPWYNERLRDTLVALPGLMAYHDDRETYLKVLDQAVEDIRRVYLAKADTDNKPANHDVDVPLWLFYTLQEIESLFPEIDICARYGQIMVEVIQHTLLMNNGVMRLDDCGLIYAKMEGVPLTWMDAVVEGKPVTWRPGYTVELNALWYNALCYYSSKCAKNKKLKESLQIADLANKVKASFIEKFWNSENKSLFDYIDEDYFDDSIRPNQVIAASLPFSPLDIDQRKSVIDVVKKELLTPRGLRTLSPSSPKYQGVLEGTQNQRDEAIHQGSVFPWLAAFFAEGYLNIHKQGGVSFVKKLVDGFEEEMTDHCLSTISECFNGNPPHIGKGAISMAWNVAAVIKMIKLIEKYS